MTSTTAPTVTLREEPKPRLPGRCGRTYELERLLGRGAYGQVWRARHRDLGRSVALKVLMPEAGVEDGTATARLHNEARVTAMLKHPHVVQVLDHDVEEGVAWIAYEDLGGGTVLDRVRRGKMEWTAVVEMGRQVAGALAEAHAHDVLHRDVKADNILENAPGSYKLVDFGLAGGGVRNGHFRTAERMVVGTPAYLAPETLRGVPASPASDQFALGIVLYFCLTGVLPHHDPRDVQKTVLARVSQTVPPVSTLVPQLPARVDAVIARMVARDPQDRFATLDEVKLALGMLLRRPTSGTVPRPVVRSSSQMKLSPLRRSLKIGRSIHDAVVAWAGRPADPHATPRLETPLDGARRAVAAFALGAGLAVSLGLAVLAGPAAGWLEAPVESAPLTVVVAQPHAAIE